MRSRASSLLVLALLSPLGCGGDPSPTGANPDAGPPRCTGSNPRACAERGPVDFSHEGEGAASESSTDDQRAALLRSNHWRTAAGLPPVNAHAQLEAAALAHSQFMANNASQCYPGAHNEVQNASCRGFTGATPGARVTAAGYRASASAEVINFERTPVASIDGWVWTVYHRFPFVDPNYSEVGWASARAASGGNTNNTMEFARAGSGPALDHVVVFPFPGQTDVPTTFQGNLEGPTPPVPESTHRWPSGTVITLTFPSTNFTVTSHRILDDDDMPVAHSFFTAATSTDASVRQLATRIAFMYPDAPLRAGIEYLVEVHATVAGEDWSKTWAFTTR